MTRELETTSTRRMYLIARLRIGYPPIWVKRTLPMVPWVWVLCGVARIALGSKVGPFTEVLFGLSLLYGFYFIERVGVGPRHGPVTAYHPLHPVFRAAGLIAGLALFIEGWQAATK